MLMRILLWAILVGSVAMGILGFQTGSVTNAIIGFVIFLVAGLVLYFLLKAFLHFGFIVAKLIFVLAIVALFIFSGIKGCQLIVSSFHSAEKQIPVATEQNSTDKASQSFENEMPQPESFWSKTKNLFHSNKTKPAPKKPDTIKPQPKVEALPQQISGIVDEVRSGYLFRIGTHFIKLYGIDAPDLKQSCYNREGLKYQCGHQSKLMLERLIFQKKVTCQIVGGDYSGNYIATCKIKKADVGASLLSVGWAVADRKVTDVYTPYEEKAHKARQGLWAGHFIAPWMARGNRANTPLETQQTGFLDRLFK